MISQQSGWRAGFPVILLFWAVVGFTNYPAPFVDDLFYIGAAINLAQHGVFVNPFCDLMAGAGAGEHFFAYMPLHSYLTAGWLHVFGISALSLHILYTLLGLFVTLLIYRLFPQTTFAWAAAIFICLATYGLLGGAGLRPDAMGLCFFLLGIDVGQARSVVVFFAKNLCLGLAVITFPNVALPAMVLSLGSLLFYWRYRNFTTRRLLFFVLAMGVAYLAAFLVLLLCIHGLLVEFLRTLSNFQHFGAEGVRNRFQFFSALGLSKWVVVQASFIILAAILLVCWRGNPRRQESRFWLGLGLCIYACLGFSSTTSASGAHLWAFACLIGGLFIMTRERWGIPCWLLYMLIFSIAAFGHDHAAIQQVLADGPLSGEQRQKLRAEIDRLHAPRLYVDAYAARELYDYRLPPHTYCFEMCVAPDWSAPKREETLPENSVSVVSVERAFPTQRNPKAGGDFKPLIILGHVVPGLSRNPYDLEILDHRS